MQIAMIEEGFHEERHSPSLEHILGDITATRFQICDIWCPFQDLGHIEQIERDAALVGDGRQMERRVGRPARGRNHGGGVLQGFPGDDIAGTDIERDEVHDLLARRHAEAVPDLVGRRRAGRVRERQADGLGDRGHGVGGELGAAGAGRRARHMLKLVQILGRHLADRVLADRLEQVLDGDRAALEGARQDRAAIDEDRRHVETAHGHHHAGQRLVAAGKADQRVIAMAAHGELDAIGDDLAGRQRGLHALVPHGDAVGDGDGAELAGRAVLRGHALLHGLRLAHQRDVARGRLVPAGGDADEGLMNLLARQPHRVIVRAMRGAGWPFRHMPARQAGFIERLCVHPINVRLNLDERSTAALTPQPGLLPGPPPSLIWCASVF